jgi:hypothetical protein
MRVIGEDNTRSATGGGMQSQITAETLPSGSDIACSLVSVTIAASPGSCFTGSQAGIAGWKNQRMVDWTPR